MNDCVFCKIVAKKLPCYKVYEDDKFLAFLDVYPRTKGHTLVVPKQHYRWVYDVPEFGAYWETALKVVKALRKTLSPSFISFITHGLDVPHAHIHIFPRYSEKGFVPDVIKIPVDEMQEISNNVRKAVESKNGTVEK